MIQNENARVWVNRILAFVAGGLLLFLIMNFGVADGLRKELDESRYAAGRLLDDAKGNFENENYNRARQSLSEVEENHPGSNEAVEGKKLNKMIEAAILADQKMQVVNDSKWAEMAAGVRKEWEIRTAAEMLDKNAKERDQMEKDMNDTLSTEWEKNKDKIRKEWEKTQDEA